MKSLLSTLVILMLLAHLVTGSWYVRKCANKLGNCRKACRNGELKTVPATGICPKGKHCCVLNFKISGCGGATTKGAGATESGAESGAGATPGAGAGAAPGPGAGAGAPAAPGAGAGAGTQAAPAAAATTKGTTAAP